MTNAEYESIIVEAAKENDQLRDRIHELENRAASGGGSFSDEEANDSPLCVGCFRWRMAVAGAIGLGAGLTTVLHPDFLQGMAASFTDNEGHIEFVETVLIAIVVIAPGLLTFIEWKKTLYESGHPGVFRAAADFWKAIKKGMGKDE